MASARAELPPLAMANGQPTKTLGDIDTILSDALNQVGYGLKGYWSYPGGFALATRMEQIYANGVSMPPPARFSNSPPIPPLFSLQYFKALFVPQQGYFRIIVFIVTDRTIVEADTTPSEAAAVAWPSAGGDALPSAVAATPQPTSVKVTAFIYEFQDSAANNASQFRLLDSTTPDVTLLDAEQHLKGAGLWAALRLP